MDAFAEAFGDRGKIEVCSAGAMYCLWNGKEDKRRLGSMKTGTNLGDFVERKWNATGAE